MYYLVNNDSKEFVFVKYYINYISKEDFSNSFKMYVTDDIHTDFSDFDNRKINNPRGVVVLPEDKPYFICLILNNVGIDTYFHELTHVHDTYLFKKHFEIETNTEIRSHKYYKVLAFWTEYHAKFIELKYTKLFYKQLSSNETDDTYIKNSINQEQINEWQKAINQYNCLSYHDVMYLFALINLVKTYHPDALISAEENYSIPWDYYDLLPILLKMENFSDFLNHIEEFAELVFPLPLN